MNKLKICFISLKVAPDGTDGEAIVIRKIYDILKSKGYDITLLTGKWERKLKDPNIIQFKIIRKQFFWFPQFTLKIIRYLRNHDFDIILGNSPKSSLPIILSGKKRFITYIHDLGSFETSLTKIPVEKYLTSYVANKATYILTVSNFIKKQFRKFLPKVNYKKIHNVYNGIDNYFRPYPKKANKIKEQLGIEGNIILYIGRIAQYKGIDDIIKAYYLAKKQIPNLNLVIGGLPDFKTKEKYNQWKQNYKDIHFIGFIPNKKLPYYYSLGDIFITYSFASEGFGLTPIEAIACGTPVICSSIPAYKEVFKDNVIFVKPRSPQLLSKEIINLLKDDNKKEQLTKKAQNFIKIYSWKKVAQKIEEIFNKFLSYE